MEVRWLRCVGKTPGTSIMRHTQLPHGAAARARPHAHVLHGVSPCVHRMRQNGAFRHCACCDQGSGRLTHRYRQPQPKAKLARGTTRGPLNSSFIMSDPLSSRIASGLQTAKAWEDPQLLKTVRDSIPFQKLLPEWYANVHRNDGVDDDGVGSIPPPGDALLHHMFPRRVFQSAEDGTASQSHTSPYARDDDASYEGDDLLLKRLTLYFKLDVMTWVNNPCCDSCGDTNTANCGIRGPMTTEEVQGQAGRVELYNCPSCDGRQTTAFPRYNSAGKLFETRRGRCGEWANLFGLYCRAVGFETRYISDFTDHVWVEVWSDRRGIWIHADACEGKIDEPSMYEHGWGKKLCYIIALSSEGGGQVADVTGRYSRKILSNEMQARRREVTPSEEVGDMIIAQINASLRSRSNLSKARQDELDRRAAEEKKFFHLAQQSGNWEGNLYNEGRISGSLAWRAARQELGDDTGSQSGNDNEADNGNSTGRLHVESIYPCPFGDNNSVISITVTSGSTVNSSSDSIVINGAHCAAGTANSISIVIVDEQTGCVLQSRSFASWDTAAYFLHSVPNERIVAMHADVQGENSLDAPTQRKLSRLSGFDSEKVSGSGSEKDNDESEAFSHQILFVGQLNHNPDWAVFKSVPCASVHAINVTLNVSSLLDKSNLKLRAERNTAPRSVCCRLPESFMPLGTQLLANEQQKRAAFVGFMESEDSKKSTYLGYTTRDGAPVYLMSTASFPLERSHNESKGDAGKDWTTHHYLPGILVPEEDAKYSSEGAPDSLVPSFDIPTDFNFYNNFLGPSLLSKDNLGNVSVVETTKALHNAKFVALYFSANWCGPCRKFSPMLAEFYMTLKEGPLPSHGLDIVFVSSDRDQGQFNQYYGKMPWLSLPFDKQSIKQSLSMRFGVRGIPALIVLDAITGAVVVPADQSRSEVAVACQKGDDAITELVTKCWVQLLPPESKSIMESLALSCADGNEHAGRDSEINKYLVRDPSETSSDNTEDGASPGISPQEQIKAIFTDLVGKEGLAPNAAAAKAIQIYSEGQQHQSISRPELPTGALNDVPWTCTIYVPGDNVGGDWEEVIEGGRVGFYQKTNTGGAKVQPDGSGLNSDSFRQIAETAKKYLDNAKKDPHASRFRRFKLSNKIFDRIARVPGGLDLITDQLGFAIYRTDADYFASIPLAADLGSMEIFINRILDKS